jgi:hypothetical protein
MVQRLNDDICDIYAAVWSGREIGLVSEYEDLNPTAADCAQ